MVLSLFGKRSRQRRVARPVTQRRSRPYIEALEERTVPADLRMTTASLVDALGNPLVEAVAGDRVFIRADYQTDGLTAADQYIARVTVDGVPIDSVTLTGTPGNNVPRTVTVSGWYTATGPHVVSVFIDGAGNIGESDESNNTFNFGFTTGQPLTLPSKFILPVTGTPFVDWSIANYVDVNPLAGQAEDLRGNGLTKDGHTGLDFYVANYDEMDEGQPIIAAASGTVIQAADGNFDRNTTSGANPDNFVIIDHGSGWRTVYRHLLANSITVRTGDTILSGQALGYAGGSGDADHAQLHFEVLHNGVPVETSFDSAAYFWNPLPYELDAVSGLLDAGTTNYDSFANNDFLERGSQVDSFARPDFWLWDVEAWFVVSHLRDNDLVQAQWYRPNGVLHETDTYDPPADVGTTAIHFFLPSDEWKQAVGTWNVALEVNGVEIGRTPFNSVNGAGNGEMRLLIDDVDYLIDNRITPLNLGTVALGAARPQVKITVVNHGDINLNLSNLVVPPGFALSGNFPAFVPADPADNTREFFLEMITDVAGDMYGSVSFNTDDPSNLEVDFILQGRVTGTPPAGAPQLTLPGPALGYIIGGPAKVIDPGATLTDSDSANFGTGRLVVSFDENATADTLGIRNQGNGVGQIGVNNNVVSFGGTAIGTFSGGIGQTPLTVQLNTSATVAATQALMRNITYRKPIATPAQEPRFVFFSLLDNSGQQSNIPHKIIDAFVGSPPTISNIQNQTINEDGTTGPIAFTVGDLESPNDLVLSATSSDTGIIPLANITFGGSGANRTVTVVPAANLFTGFPPVTITVTVTDSGGLTASDNFTITVRSVNDPPTFTKGPDITVNEDAGIQTRNNWATNLSVGPFNEIGQTLTFQVTNDNNALFFGQPSISPTGTLTFQGAPNANGVATVTVRLMDNGGTSNGGIDISPPQTFILTINPVNDAPSFTKGGNQTIQENSPPQTFPNWATNISKGPADENGQSLGFQVTNDLNGLFTVQPAIDVTGQLTYTPALDTFGTATVTVRLVDTGGTANGGVDTSAPQFFVIFIRALNVPPSVTIDNVPANPKEGKLISLGSTVTDPDSSQFTYVWSVLADNGQVVPGGTSASFSFTPQDNGKYTVSLLVTDNSVPARSDFETVVIDVLNAKPKPLTGGPYNVFANQNAQLLGGATDKGLLDTIAFAWDLDGDGQFGETGPAATRGDESLQNPIFNTAGLPVFQPFGIALRVTDDDGGTRTANTQVTVLPLNTQFDFNAANSPTRTGFIGIRGTDLFGPTTGFGWLTPVSEFDNADANAMLRDGHRDDDNTFSVRVVSGRRYEVVLWLRDKKDRDFIDIFAEGALRAQNVKVVDADKVSDYVPGGFDPNVKVTFEVISNDGTLNLRLNDKGGTSNQWVLNGLELFAK